MKDFFIRLAGIDEECSRIIAEAKERADAIIDEARASATARIEGAKTRAANMEATITSDMAREQATIAENEQQQEKDAIKHLDAVASRNWTVAVASGVQLFKKQVGWK